MSRAPLPSKVKSQAAAGYLSPSAVVRRYGKRGGFGIKLVHKWIAEWRRMQLRGVDVVQYDGKNVWVSEAAVKQKLKERARR